MTDKSKQKKIAKRKLGNINMTKRKRSLEILDSTKEYRRKGKMPVNLQNSG